MRLRISELGPIASIDLQIGDLTVLVGPQASGKSIALQMLKLAAEYPAIKKTLIDHGYNPIRSKEEFLSDYLGEGMGKIWHDKSRISLDGKQLTYNLIKGSNYKNAKHSVFYIPAQRVMTFENEWPRRFTGYTSATPFATREFSESLFLYLDRAYAKTEGKLFPHPKSLKAVFKKSLNSSIYKGEVFLDKSPGSKKRLVLKPEGSDSVIPMGAWSAGQREFTPLLLGLYKLIPGAAIGKDADIGTVIIEEPEMGLHPRAISDFMFMVMELMYRGYQVVLSTHSPNILEILWAYSVLKRRQDGEDAFCTLFAATKKNELGNLPAVCLGKSMNVYYFKPGMKGTESVDISGLSPWASVDEAGWGGLTEQSERLSGIVAEVSGNYQK